MRRRGNSTPDGEHATLTFERRYPHSIEHVWSAITTPEGLRGWLLASEAMVEGRVGGRMEMVSGPAGYRSTGSVLAWEPPRVFEYEWNVAPVPEMPRGERAIFRYELTAEGEETRVHVVVRRVTRETARGFLPGVHVFLDRLEAQLAAQPMPDWLARFAEVSPHYPEWSAHASAPEQ